MSHRITLGIVAALCVISVSLAQQAKSQVYWLFTTTPSDDPSLVGMLEGFAEGFEAENPGVEVILDLQDTTVVEARLAELIANGTPPDIMKLPTTFVPSLVSRGAIEPLEAYMTSDFARRFVASIINEGVQYQGRQFGLPWGVGARAMFYNQAIFNEAGLSAPPATWDELLSACQAIRDLGKACLGLQGGGGIETDVYFYYFLWGNGGNLYNDSLTRSALNRPEAVEALAFVQRLIAEGYTQPDPTSPAYERRAGLEALFAQGQLAMIFSGAWMVVGLPQQAPDLVFGVAPIPHNGTPTTYGVVDGIMMSSYSRNKELSWAFMQHLWRDENRVKVANLGSIPDLRAIGPGTIFGQVPALQTFIDVLPSARFIPLNDQSSKIAALVAQKLSAAYRDGGDPALIMDELTREVDEILVNISFGW